MVAVAVIGACFFGPLQVNGSISFHAEHGLRSGFGGVVQSRGVSGVRVSDLLDAVEGSVAVVQRGYGTCSVGGGSHPCTCGIEETEPAMPSVDAVFLCGCC